MEDNKNYKDGILNHGIIGINEYKDCEKDIDKLVKKYGSEFITQELIWQTRHGISLKDNMRYLKIIDKEIDKEASK